MGTDIHMYIETQETGRAWRLRATSDDIPIGMVFSMETIGDGVYVGRSSALFSILAGVRGCEEPIAEPRGLPDDADTYTKSAFQEERYGLHTPSWLTLAELQAHDWADGEKGQGFITLKAYRDWSPDRAPAEWLEQLNNSGATVITPHVANCTIGRTDRIENEDRIYVPVEWVVEPTYEGDFTTKTMPLMVRLAPDGDPNKVRLVFWFDS